MKVFDDFAYRAILNKHFEVSDWQQIIGLEDGRLRRRKWNEVFNGDGSDLGIWAGDETHELCRDQIQQSHHEFGLKLTSSSSVGIM